MNDVTSHDGHYPIAPPASERRVLGHAVPRIEDLPLVTGRGRYAGDINFPHQLHMRIVRSPKAHGRIVVGRRRRRRSRCPASYAVWTNADIAELSPIDFRADKNAEGIREFRQPALAKTFVRYVGDPVAAVFAEDPYLAEDAAELVDGRDRGPAGRACRRAIRPASSSPAAAPKRSSCATATATSKPRSATRTR